MHYSDTSLVHSFKSPINEIEIPEKFTFPFCYTPHPLSLLAAKELQDYLENEFSEKHNFGLGEHEDILPIGKMFGVLVVKTKTGSIGHLWAFSGKLADKNFHSHFVPPIYDTLNPKEHYKKMERILIQYCSDILSMENDPDYIFLKDALKKSEDEKAFGLHFIKEEIKLNKKIRAEIRNNSTDNEAISKLSNESITEQIFLKVFKKRHDEKIDAIKSALLPYEQAILSLKDKRKELSNATQKFIFDQYNFLNSNGDSKNVLDIFSHTTQLPPSGAGECAMPKLLQFAYQNELIPITMAEFWWGQSPPSEVRVHKEFYPSCRSKCEPILGFMLEGISVEDNPMLQTKDLSHQVSILYEDDYLLVVNKPHEMLSVPGKNADAISLYEVLKEKYPHATGPLLVHRLDMSTSGIVLVAKNKEVHENLQSQFIKRTVKKRYAAILNGKINSQKGKIELPIRVDLDNRPRQLVCYEYGKMSVTEYETIWVKNNMTKVHFYPITGRTHQLRLHSAHHSGLNVPILGDDLYGKTDIRLHLHANQLTFVHPVTKTELKIDSEEPF